MKRSFLVVLFFLAFFHQRSAAQCKLDSVIYYRVDALTQNKVPYICNKMVYDMDTLIGQLGYQWNGTTQKWELFNRHKIDYNANGHLIRTSVQYLSGAQWMNLNKEETDYDAKGRDTTVIFYTWNSIDTVYEPYEKTVKEYDTFNRPVQRTVYLWDKINSSWKRNYRFQLSWIGKIQVSNITSKYSTDSSKWLLRFREDLLLDSNKQFVDKRNAYQWYCDSSGCRWQQFSYADFYRDQNNNDSAVYSYDSDSSQLYQILRSTFDADGCVLTQKTYSKDPGQSMNWTDETDYVYYKKSSGLTKFEKTGFRVYPNPADRYIALSEPPAQEFELTELSTGRVLLKGTLINGRIDVSALSNGLYLLKSGSVYQKIIINH